jgi:hypothetical protein
MKSDLDKELEYNKWLRQKDFKKVKSKNKAKQQKVVKRMKFNKDDE